MIIEAFVLSLVVAFIRGGKLSRLEELPLRKTYLFLAAFVLAGAILTLIIRGGDPTLIRYARVVNVLQYVILLWAIAINLHVRHMRIVGIGTFLNFLVLTANGGLMPVSEYAIKAAGMTEAIRNYAVRHVILTSETRMAFLSDIIPIRLFGKVMSQVASIGDLVIAVGIFLMIQHYMCVKSSEEQVTSA